EDDDVRAPPLRLELDGDLARVGRDEDVGVRCDRARLGLEAPDRRVARADDDGAVLDDDLDGGVAEPARARGLRKALVARRLPIDRLANRRQRHRAGALVGAVLQKARPVAGEAAERVTRRSLGGRGQADEARDDDGAHELGIAHPATRPAWGLGTPRQPRGSLRCGRGTTNACRTDMVAAQQAQSFQAPGDWHTVVLPRGADDCYRLFCDVRRVPEWLPVVATAVVTPTRGAARA